MDFFSIPSFALLSSMSLISWNLLCQTLVLVILLYFIVNTHCQLDTIISNGRSFYPRFCVVLIDQVFQSPYHIVSVHCVRLHNISAFIHAKVYRNKLVFATEFREEDRVGTGLFGFIQHISLCITFCLLTTLVYTFFSSCAGFQSTSIAFLGVNLNRIQSSL